MVDPNMKCCRCENTDFHEVFVLKENKFSRFASKKEKKFIRVCWECARFLFKRKLYNFGHNWRCIFLDNSVITEKNKAKYMVVHT